MKHRHSGARLRGITAFRHQLPQLATLTGVALVGSGVRAAESDDVAFFERHIRPVLVEHCDECHSRGAEKLKGGLRLDFQGGWEKGGDSGPAIVPGDPEGSLVMEAIGYRNPDLEMPPDHRLAPDVVAKFREWIARGAPDPRADAGPAIASEQPRIIDLAEGRRFWSFRPIASPSPPAIRRGDWPRDPIDQFILAGIEEADLQPATDAAPEILLRRLHLDLTGLPPSVEQIADFQRRYEADPEAAIEAKADELLAHPGFGERWGRHWLDIVRYADSSGGGRAIPLPDAWRFRDYVIAAFNADRPLDQLIREHLAGDLLPFADRDEQIRNLVATGFLVLGPHNYENQDKELLDLDIVDEQIDTIGRAFLGMSIGCARCHDHKFDPIPTSDYYALAGIFTSTRSVDHANVSSWPRRPFPATPDQAVALAASKKEITRLETDLKAARRALKVREVEAPAAALPGIVVDNVDADLAGEWTESTVLSRWVGAGYIHDRNQMQGRKSVTFRPDFPEAGRYEVRLSYNHDSSRASRVPITIRHARGEAETTCNQRIKPEHDGLFHTLGTFAFAAGSGAFVRISNRDTDGFVIVDAVQFLPADEAGKAAAPVAAAPKDDAAAIELKAEVARLEKALKKAKAGAPKLPAAMAVADRPTPADTGIRVRGMPRTIGEVVPRGFLQVTQPPGEPVPGISSGSGRKELAAWITSPHNPLPARVLANRIWLHLLGRGLVRTPDNFGMAGEEPSHPELLDDLAGRLSDGGWSTKKLVRAIVLSRTYRLDSRCSSAAAARDPDNRLLSHAHRRPLDAEILRDTILLLSGQLDRTAGGPCLPPGFRSEFGHKFTSLRRSVYLPVFRNTLYEVFATFDFANPNFTVGRRPESTLPTQSLFLANSPFMHEQSAAAATELLALAAPDDRARIRLAFFRTLGRAPRPDELADSLAFVHGDGDPEGAQRQEIWAALQRALFSSVDFRYLP